MVAMAEAMLKYEKMDFDRVKVANSVDKFGVERFDKEIKKYVKECVKKRGE